MISRIKFIGIIFLLFNWVGCTTKDQQNGQESTFTIQVQSDPLPSWHDGVTKQAIIAYVKTVTDSSNADFIAVNDRIATFDNDGTLWSEQPVYTQFYFVIDRIRQMADQHPEWKTREPFKSILDGDINSLMAQGHEAINLLLIATHTGMTTDEFVTEVGNWIDTARHPVKQELYTNMVYKPMVELLSYLRANGFKTFIVSGGGIDFMRPWTSKVYGIPPDQVVGSTFKTAFDYNDGNPVIRRLPELNQLNDKAEKPVAIQRYIGQKPVFAAGNSDGDLQMLQYSASHQLKSFQLYIHHTDSIREWAYDRDSKVGTLDKGWDEAIAKGWIIVDMSKDWKSVFVKE